METMSEPGRINISENTYELVKDDFECEFRGEVFVKNKGKMNMYFVSGARDKIQDPERFPAERAI
jgi:adenylate cyclase